MMMADDEEGVLNPGAAEEAFEGEGADDEDEDAVPPEGTQFNEFGEEE
jgi:hypothetical protein